MTAWREISVPHKDVLEGTMQQAEFAADITAVREKRASDEYKKAPAFFERTYITEGMRLLLTQVAQRLNRKGGEPVIQLQTGFGGGKTHTMLAVYHLAKRECALKELSGIPALLDHAGLIDVPKANVAVLDGNAHGPAQPWKRGGLKVHTLWGELAWQLGEDEGYALVREADVSGTSPGKERLLQLLEQFSPCVVLVDELVAYVRQFPDGQALSGGTFDSNLSFIQALTEAVKQVPNAILLASLPESDVEAGSSQGVSALRALEKTFGRVQALWKPVATEEAFEIVRRRLFQPIRDTKQRDAVCRAFADAYAAEGTKVPSLTHEARYFERLVNAFPIHPEVFDRLFEDWTTLEGFQRTRGVLKLMARVIYRLWKDENQDAMIMPGSLPLYDGGCRNELTYYLQAGWDAVLERDIDGERSETAELDTKEARFGALNASRRVARTLFLGSAPASGGAQKGIRGLDRARVLLGCLQPGQSSAVYVDALKRLGDRLHYLNSSGDRDADTTRFWFDTRANLRREMEDRKGRFEDKTDVRNRIAVVLEKALKGTMLFEGTHVFTSHGDVPDDGALRLVCLPPDKPYTKQDTRFAFDEVLEFIRSNGAKPRYRSNRLVFLAPDHGALIRLRDATRTALAWDSIVEDIKKTKLVIDRLQEEQAKKELETAEGVVQRVARETYKWLLCPVLESATEKDPTVEVFPINSAGGFGTEIDRVCKEQELIITAWGPALFRNILRDFYWKDGKTVVKAMAVWEDMPPGSRRARENHRHWRRDTGLLRHGLRAGRGQVRGLQARRRRRPARRDAPAHRAWRRRCV
jgi:predicted AAA+ superfamily ATPase